MELVQQDKILFAKCTHITLGDGNKTLFWHSGWLQGRRPRDIAPLLLSKSTKKKRTVRTALNENTWIRDLNHRTGFTPAHLTVFTVVANMASYAISSEFDFGDS
jgi:hypothetical protein